MSVFWIGFLGGICGLFFIIISAFLADWLCKEEFTDLSGREKLIFCLFSISIVAMIVILTFFSPF